MYRYGMTVTDWFLAAAMLAVARGAVRWFNRSMSRADKTVPLLESPEVGDRMLRIYFRGLSRDVLRWRASDDSLSRESRSCAVDELRRRGDD